MPETRLFLKSVTTEREIEVVGELLAGRDERCGLRLLTAGKNKPSGIHAKLRAVGGEMSVEDMHSTNGTYVNGKKLAPREVVPLQDGDQVSFHLDNYAVRIQSQSLEKTVFVEESAKEEIRTGEHEEDNGPGWLRLKASGGGTVCLDPVELERALSRARELKKLARPDGIDEPHLTLIENGRLTRNILLSGGDGRTEWTLGKQSPSDIILDFPSISALHARIINNAGRWLIEDQMASNGTWVDGSQVNRRYLSSPSILGFGQVDCIFRFPQHGRPRKGLSSASDEAGSVWTRLRYAAIACAVVLLLWAVFKLLT